MIGEQQSERHLRVAFFSCFDTFRRQCIKAAISAYNKIIYAVLRNVSLNFGRQFRQKAVRGFTVPEKNTFSLPWKSSYLL